MTEKEANELVRLLQRAIEAANELSRAPLHEGRAYFPSAVGSTGLIGFQHHATFGFALRAKILYYNTTIYNSSVVHHAERTNIQGRREGAAAQRGPAAHHRAWPLLGRLHLAGPGLGRDGAFPASPCADRRDRHGRGDGDARSVGGVHRRRRSDGWPAADPAQSGAVHQFRRQADRPRRNRGVHRPALSAACTTRRGMSARPWPWWSRRR